MIYLFTFPNFPQEEYKDRLPSAAQTTPEPEPELLVTGGAGAVMQSKLLPAQQVLGGPDVWGRFSAIGVSAKTIAKIHIHLKKILFTSH